MWLLTEVAENTDSDLDCERMILWCIVFMKIDIVIKLYILSMCEQILINSSNYIYIQTPNQSKQLIAMVTDAVWH